MAQALACRVDSCSGNLLKAVVADRLHVEKKSRCWKQECVRHDGIEVFTQTHQGAL